MGVRMEGIKTRRLVAALWLVSILLAALHSWVGRHAMNPDGVTYMDISDAYRAGHWKAALNSYRSPLYSWILAPALAFTQASPDAEFGAVHAVNFLIFLVTLCCFHFLLTGVINTHPQSVFPQWALVGAAYALFLWSALTVIGLELVTPDLCVAAVLYAVTGMLLRIRKGDGRWAIFFVLGLTLGIGYLAKAALLALAPVMAILCVAAIEEIRRAIPRVILLALGFAIVAGPWVYALSSAKHRFTFGDAGALAYGWMVQGVPMLHWRGGPPGNGVPVHPDRQIYSRPDAFEFASPISGTYPPSYDYSYWAEGMVVRPQVRSHLRRLAKSLREYWTFFDEQLSGVVAIAVFLWLIGVRGRAAWRGLAQEWRLLIPVSYGFVLYAQVWVDWRYFGAYLTLFWIAILCALRIPEFERRRQVTGAAAVAIMVVLGWRICTFSYTKIRQHDPMTEHWKVASRLRALELGPGSPVAGIGDSNQAYWARLGRLRIVAEIPFDVWDPVVRTPDLSDVDIFWAASAEVREAVLRKLAETGAKVAVAKDVPAGPAGLGWHRITGTPYSVYHL
jgi:4-amino-4-deoxy-L-arabinose transferase-like glycosyltransferase